MTLFQAVDLNKPVDKKLYKGTNPTCHNFNQTTATADSAPLLVGFSTGQIQLIDPIKKELSKLYNEDVRKNECSSNCKSLIARFVIESIWFRAARVGAPVRKKLCDFSHYLSGN